MWETEAIKTQIVREIPFPQITYPVIRIKTWLMKKLTQLNVCIKKIFDSSPHIS